MTSGCALAAASAVVGLIVGTALAAVFVVIVTTFDVRIPYKHVLWLLDLLIVPMVAIPVFVPARFTLALVRGFLGLWSRPTG